MYRIYNSQKYARVLEWGKLITVTGTSQVAIQAVGFVSGILIIRILPVHEYALYTLANTMLGTLTLLADGGISTGVMALGGKVWDDKDKLGVVLSSGMDLRGKFAMGSLLLATPALIYLLRHHEASWLMTVLIVLSLIPAFFSALSGNILQIPLKLKQDILPLQKNQVGVNASRLGLLLLTIFIFPWAYIAILAAGLPQVLANIQLQKISLPYANWKQESDPAIKKKILSVVKRIFPGAVYFCLSGQISIWLISVFGTTTAISQIGALGRLAMAINLIGIVFSTLVVPRFAKTPDVPQILLKKYFFSIFLVAVLCMGICGFVNIFSSEVLWVLGSQYSSLEEELFLYVIASCLGLLSGASFNLYVSRGWVLNPFISISVSVISTAYFAYKLDISSLEGIIIFSIYVSTVQFIINGFYGVIKIFNLHRN